MENKQFIDAVSLPDEEWRSLEDYDGYLFSSLGRIISFKKRSPKLLSLYIAETRGRKYTYVHFGKEHKRRTIHRLIALAFIPNPQNLPEIDHINNDGTDNRVCNLRWCTHKENMNNPYTKKNKEIYYPRATELRTGLSKKLNIFQCDNKDKAIRLAQYKDGILIRTYGSLGEAERCGFLKTSLSAVIHGRLKTYRGYTWEIIHDDLP